MQLISGKRLEPQKVVVYGPEGIGKSTLASQFPSPVFLDVEGGTDHLDVQRFPKPSTYSDILKAVDDLVTSPHSFCSLVIDTADWAEKLMIEFLCKCENKSSIEDFGYGKGYKRAEEEWMKFLGRLDNLRLKRGMNIVFLAHALARKFELPDQAGAFDKYEMKLTKLVAPRLKEWSDMLLFLNWRTYIQKDKEGKERLGGGKERILYTTHNVTFDAKNRHGLAEELPCAFKSIAGCFPGTQATVAAKPADKTEKSPEQPEVKPPQYAVKNAGIAPNPEAPRSDTAFNAELYTMMEMSGITEAELKEYLLEKGLSKDPAQGIDNLAEKFVSLMIREDNWQKVMAFINKKRAAKTATK